MFRIRTSAGGWIVRVAHLLKWGIADLVFLPYAVRGRMQNRLVLVSRDVEVMSFVKYVNHSAPENRYDVALQFLLASQA